MMRRTLNLWPSWVSKNSKSVLGKISFSFFLFDVSFFSGMAKRHWKPSASSLYQPILWGGSQAGVQHPALVTMTTWLHRTAKEKPFPKPLELKSNLNDYHPGLLLSPGTSVKDHSDAWSDVSSEPQRIHHRNSLSWPCPRCSRCHTVNDNEHRKGSPCVRTWSANEC